MPDVLNTPIPKTVKRLGSLVQYNNLLHFNTVHCTYPQGKSNFVKLYPARPQRVQGRDTAKTRSSKSSDIERRRSSPQVPMYFPARLRERYVRPPNPSVETSHPFSGRR